MIQTTPPPTLPAVPPEVIALATEQAVLAYLPKVLEMTQRIFPGRPLAVRLEEDPEIANDRHIVLEVQVTGMDVPQLVVGQRRWSGEIFQHCPAARAWVFRISMGLLGTVSQSLRGRSLAAQIVPPGPIGTFREGG